MKKTSILFGKGFVVGLGKIIPGVSGSLLAISLGVYEESLFRMRTFFSSFQENVSYFMKLGLGIICAIVLGSKVILYALNHCYTAVMFFFLGLLLGVIPSIYHHTKKRNLSYYGKVIGMLFTLVILFSLHPNQQFVYQNHLFSNLQVILIGFLEAFTMIVPGISGTALFCILGYYPFLMQMFANLGTFFVTYPLAVVLFSLSVFLGIYLTSVGMSILLEKKETETYALIEAFSYFSFLTLFLDVFPKLKGPFDMILSCFLIMLGFFLSRKFE